MVQQLKSTLAEDPGPVPGSHIVGQSFLILVPGDWLPSLDLHRYHGHIQYINTGTVININ